MQQQVSIKLMPSEAADEDAVKAFVANATAKKPHEITGYHILKKSIDARGKQAYIVLTVCAFINEPFAKRAITPVRFQNVSKAPRKAIVIGAGPAGLFAALKLIEHGIQPVILERGKDVRARRRDLATLNKQGIINTESNYCFGEGGAGTYSDGKLYTRSNKRGDINRILNLFVQFGAEEEILYNAHPHIGTNKLPQIITAMRHVIVEHGGYFMFGKKVVDFIIEKEVLKAVTTADGDRFEASAFILATGHSARDIFNLLYSKNISLQAKPFALGVRVEHPQSLIDCTQYHCALTQTRPKYLPPASYSLVQQIAGKGVFSFCMCPGGIIAPASTHPNELVVNGWSRSKRNNRFANSGMVVSVDDSDLQELSADLRYTNEHSSYVPKMSSSSTLRMMYLQEMVERKAYDAGGGYFVAPAQRMVDFCTGVTSASLPACSYVRGIKSADMQLVLPPFVLNRLQRAFKAFGKKMRGFYTNDAVVVAAESRTSSPVRIPRDSHTLQHPHIKNLFPCGEGAGYAGGIASAAMDGERVAAVVVEGLTQGNL